MQAVGTGSKQGLDATRLSLAPRASRLSGLQAPQEIAFECFCFCVRPSLPSAVQSNRLPFELASANAVPCHAAKVTSCARQAQEGAHVDSATRPTLTSSPALFQTPKKIKVATGGYLQVYFDCEELPS
jgi:hypothetical protein